MDGWVQKSVSRCGICKYRFLFIEIQTVTSNITFADLPKVNIRVGKWKWNVANAVSLLCF